MQHLLEIRAARQFLEAAPVFRTLGLGDAVAGRVQIERALLAGANVLAARLAVLFVCLMTSCSCRPGVLAQPDVGETARRSINHQPNSTDGTSNSW